MTVRWTVRAAEVTETAGETESSRVGQGQVRFKTCPFHKYKYIPHIRISGVWDVVFLEIKSKLTESRTIGRNRQLLALEGVLSYCLYIRGDELYLDISLLG